MHYSRKPYIPDRLDILILVIPLVLIFLVCIAGLSYKYLTITTSTGTVEHKERFCETSSECYWMVLTDQGEYLNQDSWLHLKWDSTTVQRKLALGETYTLTHYGWRVPILSMYPNIIKVE